MFCHICRKEEVDFTLCLKKIIKGGTNALASTPQAMLDMICAIPQQVIPYLGMGVFVDEEETERLAAAPAAPATPADLTQDLGDRLTEYELVEDLIERGTLQENADGTLCIRLQ